MPRLKLTLEYDGGDYVGWQSQDNGRSIQGEVERALESLLGARVRVIAAGRTDAGVHAEGQVICFDTARELPLKAYRQGLNGMLPLDIAVVRAEEVSPDFDARRWALGKVYRYRISNRRTRSPLRRRTHWEVFHPLDADEMREAARCLVGRHDFSAFRAADCQSAHGVRQLNEVRLEGEGGGEGKGELVLTVRGTAFLKHMVRNIVGSLVEVGKGRRPASWMAEILEAKNRLDAGPTAPPQGLVLVEVVYGEGPPVKGKRPAGPSGVLEPTETMDDAADFDE